MTIQEIAKKIVRQKDQKQPTILFLGAGASISAGIPATPGIINYLKESSEFNHISGIESKNYFELMGQLAPGERKKLLNHFIDRGKVNETHFIVGLLMSEQFIDYVITTNFDPLIEKSAILFQKNYQVYDLANNVSLIGHELSIPSLIYLHGKYRNVWQLNTADELLGNVDSTRSIISQLASKQATWLIVGYSGSDFIFDEISKIQMFNQGLYWIGYKQEPPIKKVQEKLLSKPKKNAFGVKGYTSDSFFKELLDGITCHANLDSIRLGNKLNFILLSQQELQNPLGPFKRVEVGSQIHLTEQCEEWIKYKVTALRSEDLGRERNEGSFLTNLRRLLVNFFIVDPKRIASIKTMIRTEKYQDALELSEIEIKENSKSMLGYYYKGIALSQIGEGKEDPKERYECFKKMVKAFDSAISIADKTESVRIEIERITAVKKVLWRNEHNKAVKLVTDDNLKKIFQNPLELSIQHLKNATLIQPKSDLSWDVLSQVAAMDKDFKTAISAKEKWFTLVPETAVDANDYMRLASYYYQLDKQQKVVEVFQKAQKMFPKNEIIITNLADAYSRTENSNKAFKTVKNLVEQFPDNPQYYLVLGTLFYQQALQLSDTLSTNVKEISELQEEGGKTDKLAQLKQENKQFKEQITELTNRAEEELKTTLKYRPNDATAYNTLGIIYQNKARSLFDERNQAADNKKAAELNNQGKDVLREAMEYYEHAAKIDPDNQSYWKSLFSIYTALGMDEKADEANCKIKNKEKSSKEREFK